MPDRVAVNFPAMAQAVADVNACHNGLVQQREDLDQYLANLRQTWLGAAGDNWRIAQGEWNTACDEVNQILLQLHNALEVALHNYSATERSLTQMWSR
jgi:ESAT-6 family protein